MSMMIKGNWFVMDSRAHTDIESASILESIGRGVLQQPPRKTARRNWGGHNACLCFAEPGKALEYIETIP